MMYPRTGASEAQRARRAPQDRPGTASRRAPFCASFSKARAIVWAQWRSTRNHLPRSNVGGLVFTGGLTAIWYLGFAYLAVLAGILLSRPNELAAFRKLLPAALLICFLYW